MKRLVALTLFVFAAMGLFSQEIDFSVTLAKLHQAAESGDDSLIPTDRQLIIDGDLGTVTVYEDTETDFIAEVELISGSWLGEETIELYRAYAIFEGLVFKPYFSRSSPDRLQGSQSLLLLANYLGIGFDYDGITPVAVLEVLDIRLLR